MGSNEFIHDIPSKNSLVVELTGKGEKCQTEVALTFSLRYVLQGSPKSNYINYEKMY